MLSRSRLISASIVTFWLVMMGTLVKNEFGVKRLSIEDQTSSRPGVASESWLGIFLTGGQRVGYVHLRQNPESRQDEPGVHMLLEARMQLQLLGKSTDLNLSGSVWRSDSAPRAEFDFAVRSSGFDFEVKGDVASGELNGEMTSAGEVVPLRLPIDDSLIFSNGFGSALRFPALEVGDEFRLDSFDPLTLSKSEARVKCIARETLRIAGSEVLTCRLTVTTAGLSSLAWIDDHGDVVRAETPVGLVLERLNKTQALQSAQSLDGVADGLLAETAIRPSGKLPFRSARVMTARLSGLESLSLPEDRTQTSLGSGVYRLKMPEEAELLTHMSAELAASKKLAPGQVDSVKDPREEPPAIRDSTVSRYLEADAFVQSDHPKLRAQAAAIVRDEDSMWQKSLKIHDWVFTRLEKEPVVSIPSALEVLEQRRGDCNEHTVLFTALARAASIPTRIAIGIVWSDELEGFYYHAWPEVFLGTSEEGSTSEWVWMDPTLGQSLADATHIKLLNGGIETWPQLLPYLGKLNIEILEIE